MPYITMNVQFSMSLYQACKLVYYVSFVKSSDELPRTKKEFLDTLRQFIEQKGDREHRHEINHFTDDPTIKQNVTTYYSQMLSGELSSFQD